LSGFGWEINNLAWFECFHGGPAFEALPFRRVQTFKQRTPFQKPDFFVHSRRTWCGFGLKITEIMILPGFSLPTQMFFLFFGDFSFIPSSFGFLSW
jgi:hypothetical protein